MAMTVYWNRGPDKVTPTDFNLYGREYYAAKAAAALRHAGTRSKHPPLTSKGHRPLGFVERTNLRNDVIDLVAREVLVRGQ